jgi:release factor glutamine methyltransferase
MNRDVVAPPPHALGREAAAAIEGARIRLMRAGIGSARLDAELLMAAAAGVSRATLVSGTAAIDAVALGRFQALLARREAREPLAYIVGQREFFSLEFAVGPEVLIPRPETERVVEVALNFLSRRSRATVLDLGTGSGAIAIALAKNHTAARIVAVDISKAALELATENARRHLCAGQIMFLKGDCFAALDRTGAPFDLIVSNPPYVAESDLAALEPEVRTFEPRLALAGGRDGLKFHRKIANGLARWLARDGEVIVEVGEGQAVTVETMMRRAGCSFSERIRDLSGIERAVRARFSYK